MRSIVAWVLGIYAAFLIVVNLPFSQEKIADIVASSLSEKLGTEVNIGSINVGFLNRIIVNDLEAFDRNGEIMLKVGRASASVDYLNLLKGNISIPSAQLYSATAVIYKEKPGSPLNIQYVIDAFSSGEDNGAKKNLRINTLLARHINVRYDVHGVPGNKGKLNVDHLDVRDCGFNLSIKNFTEDSLNLSLKRVSLNECNSGLNIRNLAFKIEANRKKALVSDLVFSTDNSSVSLQDVIVSYRDNGKGKEYALLNDAKIEGTVKLSDFGCLVPKLQGVTDDYSFTAVLSGNRDKIKVKSFKLHNEDYSTKLDFSAVAENLMDDCRVIDAEIYNAGITSDGLIRLTQQLDIDGTKLKPLFNCGSISVESAAHYDINNTFAQGTIKTSNGSFDFNARTDTSKVLICDIRTNGTINVGKIIDNDKLGNLEANINAEIDLSDINGIPSGKIIADLPVFEYNGYAYNNIRLDVANISRKADIKINVDDENVNAGIRGYYGYGTGRKDLNLSMDIKDFNPCALKLVDKYPHERLSFCSDIKLKGTDIDDLNGTVNIDDITLVTPDTVYSVDKLLVTVLQSETGTCDVSVTSDFLNARLKGHNRLSSLVSDFTNVLATNLSEVIKPVDGTSDSSFDYDISFVDAPILHHFIPTEYIADDEIRVIGSVNVPNSILNMSIDVPGIRYGDDAYKDVSIVCCNNREQLSVKASGMTHNEKSAVRFDVNAVAKNNVIDSDLKLKLKNQNDIDVNLKSRVSLSDSIGKLRTLVNLNKADLLINDTLWNVTPAEISIYDNDISCHNLQIYNGDKYLMVEGKASPNPSDSLVARLKNIDVEYILNLVNFTALNFSGVATGEATLYNILGKPDFEANLNVRNFGLEGNLMGNAQINGYWDESVNGISLEANIVDMYKCHKRLTSELTDKLGITKVKGYVSPAENDIYLHIDAQDTHANVLEGYLGIIFRDIDGYLRGTLDVVGPLNKVDLVGDVTGEMAMTLKSTNVPYMIEDDTIHIRRGLITLDKVRMYDSYGNVGVLDGYVSHNSLRNFAYSFDADANNMLVYDEKEFNSNKFKATAFASGSIHVDGSDGHPLNIVGNLTTTKGSVFAYDNVSPDALASSSFIEFRDMTYRNNPEMSFLIKPEEIKPDPNDLSQYIKKKEKKKSDYEGDIFMDFHVNMNPNCEVKLRMDRMDDAYISAFGNAVLQAKWHNKGTFELFGTYNVERGDYRLYMHDLVYRDLSLQPGSSVAFNGNPFDAGIHLICNHEIHNVPLSDLTSTTAYSQNNKVKVVCILDISGTISAMDFKFDLSLPNVNDETRQLVRSMINSDEEMNTQMIYLLAVNRFYPNDFSRSNGEDRSGQAVNSFVSSTLSGQINQMLSNIIGTNSNWNFGTGISTGEKGWQDMDVEGILSGRLFNDRLLVNGNFGYRDNALTNTSSFIGDFELKWRLWEKSNTYLKAYNMTNDRYFTKGTLNTQGLGISVQFDFESIRSLFNKNVKEENAEE